ncbi:MAG: PKD domain-containing protein [Candidatus Wildermuthbacteria bacterium]|nr:PKD domain-containing protein [Candidatus Wildermuthbacteria bacterium]
MQISLKSGFSSLVADSGKVSSSSGTYAPAGLGYATGYYWRVKVWDAEQGESAWAGSSLFTTKAQHPDPDFTWSPTHPALNTQVRFTDRSSAYGGAAISSWTWSFEQGNPASSTLQHPATTFTQQGQNKQNAVTLLATDTKGNSCSATKSVAPSIPLPQWEEISPLSWIQKILQLL